MCGTAAVVDLTDEPDQHRIAAGCAIGDEMLARLEHQGADELFAGYHHLRELDEEALRLALVEGLEGLHNLNLQRCDRVTMAHGLEARVPFLSRDLVAVAERIPISWKLLGEDGQEKALLREAFEGWLPDEILWRRKEQFGEGSGTVGVMARRAEALVPEEDWASMPLAGIPGTPDPGGARLPAGVLPAPRGHRRRSRSRPLRHPMSTSSNRHVSPICSAGTRHR